MSGSMMNILIIEDDNMVKKVLGHQLLDEGYTVSLASNGQEALELLEENRHIDVVVCDVLMPVLTGPTFLLKMKKFFPEKLPFIIIISVVKEGEEFLKKIDIEYDYFLKKP